MMTMFFDFFSKKYKAITTIKFITLDTIIINFIIMFSTYIIIIFLNTLIIISINIYRIIIIIIFVS